MNDRDLRFSETYIEELDLPGGLHATLRTIRSDDKEALVEGFAHVSARSRYLRFFTGKPRLTAADLHYFTEIDGIDHFAIGALVHDEATRDQPAATARFVREPGSNSAEFALTVVDEFQHLGLGAILLDRLMSAARERGYENLSGEILAENTTMLDLVQHVAPGASLDHDGPLVHCAIPLA